jgi:hypothetical protein
VFPAGDTSTDPKADATSKKLQGVREKLGVYMVIFYIESWL